MNHIKYAHDLDQEMYENMIKDIELGFRNYFNKLHLANNTLSPDTTTLNFTPEIKNNIEHPFPLAAKLYEVYRWLIGEIKTPPNDITETLDDILDLIWNNPFIFLDRFSNEVEYDASNDINWDFWCSISIGKFYRYAKIAFRLYEGHHIKANELAFMCGVSPSAISQNIKNEKINANKDTTWKIESEDAIAYIQSRLRTKK